MNILKDIMLFLVLLVQLPVVILLLQEKFQRQEVISQNVEGKKEV